MRCPKSGSERNDPLRDYSRFVKSSEGGDGSVGEPWGAAPECDGGWENVALLEARGVVVASVHELPISSLLRNVEDMRA